MLFHFYDILCLITVFQFLFFAFFLLDFKKGRPISNKFLALFLTSKAFCYLDDLFFRFYHYFYEHNPHLFFWGFSFEFLLGPSLLFFVLTLCYENYQLKKWHGINLLPFFLHISYVFFHYHRFSADVQRYLLSEQAILSRDGWSTNTIIIYLHFIFYTILCLIVIYRYRKELKGYFSSIENAKMTWLSLLISGFTLIWVTSLTDYIVVQLGHSHFIKAYMPLIGIFIFSNLIVYKGLNQPSIFLGIPQKTLGPKYAKSPLTPEDKERYVHKLNHLMTDEKLYLDPSINIEILSKKVSIPSRYISQVLNENLNQSFYDFINSHRIEESKKLLVDPAHQDKTVLEVLYDVGFNSKSVFNTSFKKYTGMTPSEYKRKKLMAIPAA